MVRHSFNINYRPMKVPSSGDNLTAGIFIINTFRSLKVLVHNVRFQRPCIVNIRIFHDDSQNNIRENLKISQNYITEGFELQKWIPKIGSFNFSYIPKRSVYFQNK